MKAPELEPGRIVGQRYTIRRLVARRPSSSLYEAITAPSRETLLEVFAVETAVMPDVEARLARLTEEVNALPANIVLPIIEAGVDHESGFPFIASEGSVTPSLAELVKLCPLAADELVAFVGRLCAALDAAHARGLVHAALDPARVFVGPAPRCDVRIAGLGTAFLNGHGCDLVWSAPEAYAPTPASDVYSAAMLTVYAALGELPADPASVVSAAARDVVSIGPRSSALDGRIAGPLARALAPAAAERHARASDLARQIAEALGSEFVASGAWPAAVPAVPANRVEAAPLPPAATSVDALTTPVGAPAPLPPLDSLPPPRAFGSRAKLIAVVAAVLVFIGVFSVVISTVAGGPPRATGHVASVAPVASAMPIATTQSAPAPSPAPAPVIEPAPSAPPNPAKPSSSEGTLVVDCTPECQSITVDGKPIEGASAALRPGTHVIVVKRGLHAPQTKYVKLLAGRETKISFIWWKTPPGPPGAAPKKPCGKFLQRCN